MMSRSRHAGFTLIEAIIVIAITGIIAGIVATFIRQPVEGYTDSTRRAQLSEQADLALRRMVRDIRLALPYSLRLSNSGGRYYLEFILTQSGGRYRTTGDGSTSGNILNWTDASARTFDILGPPPSTADIAGNDWIVVNNLGVTPANAYDCSSSSGCNRVQVQSISGNTVTLLTNVFASQIPSTPSSSARFFVVPNNQQAVTYSCPSTGNGDLIRHWAYGFNPSQTIPSGGQQAIAATGARCTIDYSSSNAYGQNRLIYVQLTLTDNSGESVQLFQQIHVDNAP